MGCVLESLFLWVSKVEGRRAVLVPDPCLSGAAVFTYCEEGSCHLCLLPSEQAGATPPPRPKIQRQTDTRVLYISED